MAFFADGPDSSSTTAVRDGDVSGRRLPGGDEADGVLVGSGRPRPEFGILMAALTLGSALPHLIEQLGTCPWRVPMMAAAAVTAA